MKTTKFKDDELKSNINPINSPLAEEFDSNEHFHGKLSQETSKIECKQSKCKQMPKKSRKISQKLSKLTKNRPNLNEKTIKVPFGWSFYEYLNKIQDKNVRKS